MLFALSVIVTFYFESVVLQTWTKLSGPLYLLSMSFT